MKFSIEGSAVVLPERAVLSEEIDRRLGMAEGHVASKFGLRRRYWANTAETSSAMAAGAATAALAQAGWMADSVDVIVGACGVMEQPIPGTAPLVQRRLGLGDSGIPAFDVNASCLSFVLALDQVLAGFALRRWRRALIFTADIASAALDFSDPEASVIFGDGASAVVLSAGGEHECLGMRLQTFGSGAQLCGLDAGGTRVRLADGIEPFMAAAKFRMDGPGVFRATARRFPAFLRHLFEDAGIAPQDLDTIIPHQASAPALEHLKRSLPGGHGKTVDLFADHGNQIATSLPHALHAARTAGRLGRGTHSLLVGSSAGISLGGMVVRW